MSKRKRRRGGTNIMNSMALKIVGGFAIVAVVLGALLFTGYGSTNDSCKAAGFLGAEGIDGCKADPDYSYDRIAIVAGNTANNPQPQLSAELEKYIKNSLLYNSKAKITIFSATPNHDRINYEEIEIKADGDNDTMVRSIDEQIEKINLALEAEPAENGAEYLETIQRAAASVQGKGENSVVLVIGSGLSDQGPLNYAKDDLLEKTPQNLLDALKKSDVINTKISYSVDLCWFGLGSTVKPQATLTERNITNLQAQYLEVLSELGMRVEFDNDVTDGIPVQTKYTVKTVPVKTNKVVFEQAFDDTSALGFKEGSTELRIGTDAAWSELEKSGLVTTARENPEVAINVEGYVAVICGQDADIALASNRANAIKNLLVSHGISNPIRAQGVGQTTESKDKGICVGKSSDADLQKQRVVIISMKE